MLRFECRSLHEMYAPCLCACVRQRACGRQLCAARVEVPSRFFRTTQYSPAVFPAFVHVVRTCCVSSVCRRFVVLCAPTRLQHYTTLHVDRSTLTAAATVIFRTYERGDPCFVIEVPVANINNTGVLGVKYMESRAERKGFKILELKAKHVTSTYCCDSR